MLMCMCMLIKRTNILFDEETWKILTGLATQKQVSASELIRKAIKRTYFSEGKKMDNKKIFNQIVFLRKKLKGKIDYRKLIEDGRKH